jgi:prepilin-type N-terminal cleavage/methylation domain-containing protein
MSLPSFQRSGFTIIEIMVSIVVFCVGIIAAYVLISSSISLSMAARDEIIASNLAREQIELVKNVRDSNWLRHEIWNKITDYITSGDNVFETGVYTIENNYSPLSPFPISITKIDPTAFSSNTLTRTEIKANHASLALCLDTQKRTVYCHGDSSLISTRFSRFFIVEPIVTKNTNNNTNISVTGALRVRSIVTVNEPRFRIYEIPTIITDWKK